MTSFWLNELRKRFGEHRVEDALEGTALAELGKTHNFGLYVVRNAILGDHAAELMRQSKKDIESIIAGSERKQRAVAVQGDKRHTKFHNTAQACRGNCRCKYFYSGTKRHMVYGMDQVPCLDKCDKWLLDLAIVPSQHMFNEAIVNVYSHDENENIDWHTDRNPLYSDNMDVLAEKPRYMASAFA